MSNYISNENQRLLWKMAHKIPAFAQLEPPKKEFEFKRVVEYFYRKYSHLNLLSVTELQRINRETLAVFLPNKPPPVPVPGPSMVESRQEKSQRAFQERQNVYEDMNRKPDLPNPEEIFREKNIDDEKIQNMDDLIMNYQKQREKDYNSIPPPVVSKQTSPAKLKLLDETILTENDVDDLESSRVLNKKSVSWNSELLQPPEWQSRMDSLEQKIKKLENRNDTLERRMEEMEDHLREKKKTSKTEMEIPMVVVNSILNDTIHKIEKMDSIKNKMKMFSSI
jgi:hypothetical protein